MPTNPNFLYLRHAFGGGWATDFGPLTTIAPDGDLVTIPWLAYRDDVDLLATITATVPRLSDSAGWGVRFGRELNASDDRRHFVTIGSPADSPLLTIIEGKHLEPFRVLADTATVLVTPRLRTRTR